MLPSPDPRPGTSLKQRLVEIDWIGAPLLLGAIMCFTMAINFGGVLYDWDSGSEIALFVVAGVLFILFGFQQAFCIGTTKARRIFPVNLIRAPLTTSRTPLLMFFTTAAGGAGIFLPVYFIPLFFQFARDDSPVDAAVRLLPFILVMIFVTLVQGALFSHPSGRFGLYMPWFALGGALAITGGTLMYLVETTTSQTWIYGSSALLAAGVGTFTQAGFAITQASVPHSLAAVAAAFIALAQAGGGTIALAIANAVFVNNAQDRLVGVLPSSVTDGQVEAAIAGVGGDFVKLLPPQAQAAVLDAIVQALRKPYILTIVAGGVVLASSLLMKRERLFLAAHAPGA